MARQLLIAGNWKMNGKRDSLAFFDEVAPAAGASAAEILICPPATLLAAAVDAASGASIKIGGQDCHANSSGAHTGDVSADMLVDAGADYVILGHSERRSDHGESSASVAEKAAAALSAGLTPIICVGESEAERRDGRAEAVVAEQVVNSLPKATDGAYVIAYEPVWAIGTGLTASLEDIQAMHGFIRGRLPDGEKTRILYGGSVKPGNAAEIFALADVDGGLIGGASLKASDFAQIIKNTAV
ncbi:triose-phosphate isomerase [Maricaulis sp.]|uniref:triose-phosphate isomerase n=1 Tax=Maricaulis sp. TaxID=1486257 RepID=UPI00260C530F|nr:triose-phosphate isomerase [Maricaulis sp.]